MIVLQVIVFLLGLGLTLATLSSAIRQTVLPDVKAFANAHPQHAYPPILLIHGEEDSVIPIAEARSLEAQARALKFELETYYVKGAEHCGAYELDPQRYIQVVQQFL